MNIQIKRIIQTKFAARAKELVGYALEHDFPYKTATIKEYKEKVYGTRFFREFITAPKHALLGAFDGKNLIGIAAIKVDMGGVAYLEWIVVDKEYRGKGIGCSLISAVEKWTLSRKCHYLHLLTESKNNREHFYPNRGFTLLGVHKNSWFGEDEYMFAKNLRPTAFREIYTQSK